MKLTADSLKFIFGLKLGNLRKAKGLSLKELSSKTGLSISYLNEIENGKKYPKGEKIIAIAQALEVSFDELISADLTQEVNKLSVLLENNPLTGLPLDIFGISSQELFQFMAKNPESFSGLTGTLLELARIFNIQVDDVYSAVLRAFLHMNQNFFPTIEDSVDALKKEEGLYENTLCDFLTKESLRSFLLRNYKYDILESDFKTYAPPLHNLHFFLRPGPRPRLYLNRSIGGRQKIFIMARELAYQRLALDSLLKESLSERFLSSKTDQPGSYAQLYNLFAASYFTSALLIPRETFVQQAHDFFRRSQWDLESFVEWVHSYPGTRRSFFHRLSQVLPKHLGLGNIFYFRFSYRPEDDDFRVVNELHLSGLQVPHRLRGEEHYCRRWIATALVQQLSRENQPFLAGIQRAHFVGTEREYLCFAMAYPFNINPKWKEGVTLGILVDENVRQKINFLEDPQIPSREVSRFCEWCSVTDCTERIAPPRMVTRIEEAALIEEILQGRRTPEGEPLRPEGHYAQDQEED